MHNEQITRIPSIAQNCRSQKRTLNMVRLCSTASEFAILPVPRLAYACCSVPQKDLKLIHAAVCDCARLKLAIPNLRVGGLTHDFKHKALTIISCTALRVERQLTTWVWVQLNLCVLTVPKMQKASSCMHSSQNLADATRRTKHCLSTYVWLWQVIFLTLLCRTTTYWRLSFQTIQTWQYHPLRPLPN